MTTPDPIIPDIAAAIRHTRNHLAHCDRDLPAAANYLSGLIDNPPPNPGGTETQTDPGRSISYNDPTGAAIEARTRAIELAIRLGRHIARLEAAAQNLHADLRIAALRGQPPSTDRTPATRCDGGWGDKADPTCERLAVHLTRRHGIQLAVCHPCYQRCWESDRGAA